MAYIHRVHPNRDLIKALIDARYGGNVSDCAREAKVGPATLHDILSGRRQGREETLSALADALGVSVDLITVKVQEGAA